MTQNFKSSGRTVAKFAFALVAPCALLIPATAIGAEVAQVPELFEHTLEAYLDAYSTLGMCDEFVTEQAKLGFDPYGSTLEQFPDWFRDMMFRNYEEFKEYVHTLGLTYDERMQLCLNNLPGAQLELANLLTEYHEQSGI